jgi:hypothetical protein
VEQFKDLLMLVVPVLVCGIAAVGIYKGMRELIRLIKGDEKVSRETLVTYTPSSASAVPVGFKQVYGYTLQLDMERQNYYIPGRSEHEEALRRGQAKGVIYRDKAGLQKLLEEYAGTGIRFEQCKEKVEFGQPLGQYMDPVTKLKVETTVGIIHYSREGIYIVPARPDKGRRIYG